jgi:hypothetical protein
VGQSQRLIGFDFAGTFSGASAVVVADAGDTVNASATTSPINPLLARPPTSSTFLAT